MKNIIITAGPTNERIDAVMKITNMSTGALGCRIAEKLLSRPDTYPHIGKIWYISPKMARKPEDWWDGKLEFIQAESTDNLLDALTELLTTEKIDAVIHSAAVGDYKGKYVVRAEDLADEIAGSLFAVQMAALAEKKPIPENTIRQVVLDILDSPKAVQDDNTKISSYEPRLMVALGLTEKVISHIKRLSPNTMLIAFKLLEGVTKEKLFQVASALKDKNQADFIIANDLAKIGGGKHWAMVVGTDPKTGENTVIKECQDKDGIADTVADIVSTR